MNNHQTCPKKSTKQEQTDRTLLAIRIAIQQYGLPAEIYVDTGTAILPKKSVSM